MLDTDVERPCGDLVSLGLYDRADGILVTDLGETERWVHNCGLSLPDEAETAARCARFGAAFERGQILARGGGIQDVQDCLRRVAHACADVSFAADGGSHDPEGADSPREIRLKEIERFIAFHEGADAEAVAKAFGLPLDEAVALTEDLLRRGRLGFR